MLQKALIILLSALSVSCAAKTEEARRLEHVCIFEMAVKLCEDKGGIANLKITIRENEGDLAVVRCYKSKKVERFTCHD